MLREELGRVKGSVRVDYNLTGPTVLELMGLTTGPELTELNKDLNKKFELMEE